MQQRCICEGKKCDRLPHFLALECSGILSCKRALSNFLSNFPLFSFNADPPNEQRICPLFSSAHLTRRRPAVLAESVFLKCLHCTSLGIFSGIKCHLLSTYSFKYLMNTIPQSHLVNVCNMFMRCFYRQGGYGTEKLKIMFVAYHILQIMELGFQPRFVSLDKARLE